MKSVNDIVFGHWTLAIIMAFITWFGIREITKHERIITVKHISFDPGNDWVVVDKSADHFDVRFRGPQSEILQLNADQIRIDLGAAAKDASEQITCKVQLRDVIAPKGVSALSVEPSTIEIRRSRLEKSDEITLTKLKVLTLSEWSSEQISLAPGTVDITVQGTENSLTEANIAKIRVYVDCVDLPVDSSADVQVQVRLPAGLSMIEVEPKSINVQISALKASSEPRSPDGAEPPTELKLAP